jgi:hypothetical protein
MYYSLKDLIAGCIFCVLVGGTASLNAEVQGSLEGHLQIFSSNPVEPADKGVATKTAENYADYPLLILSRDGKKEIARVTADRDGNYRVGLPPGDYILDVQGRRPKGHLRAKPQPFTVVSNQTVRVDMYVDTDHSRSSAAQSFRPD